MRNVFISRVGCILAILLALTVTGCKNSSKNWSKTYGLGYFNSIEQTSDGGYIAGGLNKIMKIDASGNSLWQKLLGVWNPGTQSSVVIIHQTQDGGYIAVKRIDSSSPIGASFWYGDVLIKLNAKGKTEWNKDILSPDGTLMDVISVRQTSDNGYILSGGYTDTDGVEIGVLSKMNTGGNILWSREFEGVAFSAWENPAGGYSLIESIPVNSDNDETMIIKTDENGIEVWRKAYEDTATCGETVTADGSIVLAVEDIDTENAAMLKIDAGGNVIWKQVYPNTGKTDGMGFIKSIEKTSDNGYMIAGRCSKDGWMDDGAWIVRTDQDGNETCRWSNDFGKTLTLVEQVRPTLDGGYVLAGCMLPESAVNKAWLAKTDANGHTSD
jgi:hypothetical protein